MNDAKIAVIEFAKTADQEEYIHVVVGSRMDAEAFLQRMRTELSRFRRMVREAQRTPKTFKMIKREIRRMEPSNPEKWEIVLLKSEGYTREIENLLADTMRKA